MAGKALIAECSQIIYDGFIRYNNAFHRITRRARARFERRDWKGHQQDIVDRVDLYRDPGGAEWVNEMTRQHDLHGLELIVL